ncbi:MAG TPA: heparinase II/III family protein [Phycisphaerae bacterium]|nr:heparinase II/III family protein [Phycisphaerae bacterium]HRY68255.1 heparinase II/III family protein [Phycisphaerae bacterium]HSA29944.1 heparinase II/III family protein [Phycisphaerae bacterium]
MRGLILTFCLLSVNPLDASAAEDWLIPRSHPRLLIGRDDLARLRVHCGISQYADDPVARSPGLVFGSQRDVLERLTMIGSDIMMGRARSDDLWVPAVLHLVTGNRDRSDVYTDYVVRQLLDPERRRLELDAVIALDYCWDAIKPEHRGHIVARMTPFIEPIRPGDSPLNPILFERRLASLAAAIVLTDEQVTERDASLVAKIKTVTSIARSYLEGDLVSFCKQRGAMPTSGGLGVFEEAQIVLAAEIWRTGAGRSIWPELANNAGRAMEPYFYADTGSPALNHGFIHDHGTVIPRRPGEVYHGFVPAVPWVIARALQDPIATWYANRAFPPLGVKFPPEAERYRWTQILYGPADQPEAARRACPLGRNFGGGWVAMRSGWMPGDTVVLFDAGQPFWQARQHADAGQFQIYRKHRLTIDSGDDVTFNAVPTKGGKTLIGGERADWDLYYAATIAHNCITVAERFPTLDKYDRNRPAMGNQRYVTRDFDMAVEDITKTTRHTGTLLAFETNSFYSYTAADLTPAYPAETVQGLERRLLFLPDGALLVLDRLQTVRAGALKTWHLQLPARPRLLGDAPTSDSSAQPDTGGLKELEQVHQLHGLDARGGIWEPGDLEPWLEITHGEGRLFVKTLLPADARRRVVGGPMEAHTIVSGSSAGTSYYGGGPQGYEHRLWPASILRAPNASYTLGMPTGLGSNFGVGATWGRLDVTPAGNSNEVLFLHLLIPTDRSIDLPPPVVFKEESGIAILEMPLNNHDCRVDLNLGAGRPGRVILIDRAGRKIVFEKELADSVLPNLSIPGATR